MIFPLAPICVITLSARTIFIYYLLFLYCTTYLLLYIPLSSTGISILSSLDPLLGMVLYLVHLLHNKLNFGSPASLSLLRLHQLSNFSCPYSILAIHLRTRKKTFFTSRETVSGEGTWYLGRPVFMRDRNARSFTTWKGCLLLETQQTISALGSGVKKGKASYTNSTYLASIVVC